MSVLILVKGHSRTFEVIGWAAGQVGLCALLDTPALERVGAPAFSPDKLGRQAGELRGTDETGTSASPRCERLRDTAAQSAGSTALRE